MSKNPKRGRKAIAETRMLKSNEVVDVSPIAILSLFAVVTCSGQSNLSKIPVDSKGSFHSLMERLRSGDSAAANEVHERYAHRLMQLAARRVAQKYRAKFDPDDVVQSVFHSFFQRHAAGQFDFGDWNNLWSLLANITIRKCGKHVQAFSRDKRDVNREHNPLEETSPNEIGEADATLEHAIVFEETLQQLLDELTEDQQAVLILKLQDFSIEEISERVGRTERTIYRVLTLIRDRLNEIARECE